MLLRQLTAALLRTSVCPKCGAKVNLQLTHGACPRCGQPVARNRERAWNIRRWVLALVCVLSVPLYFVPFIIHAGPLGEVVSTATIALCCLSGLGALISATLSRRYRSFYQASAKKNIVAPGRVK